MSISKHDLGNSREFRIFVAGYLSTKEGFNGEFPGLRLNPNFPLDSVDTYIPEEIDEAVRSLSQSPSFVRLFSLNTGIQVE